MSENEFQFKHIFLVQICFIFFLILLLFILQESFLFTFLFQHVLFLHGEISIFMIYKTRKSRLQILSLGLLYGSLTAPAIFGLHVFWIVTIFLGIWMICFTVSMNYSFLSYFCVVFAFLYFLSTVGVYYFYQQLFEISLFVSVMGFLTTGVLDLWEMKMNLIF